MKKETSNTLIVKRDALMDDEGCCDITHEVDKYQTSFVRRPKSDGTYSYIFDFENKVFVVSKEDDRLVAIRQPGMTIGHIRLTPEDVVLEVAIYESCKEFFSFKKDLLKHDFGKFIGMKMVMEENIK